MRLVFPNSHRINRGNYVVKELADACRSNDITDLIVLHEHRGIPDALIVSHFPHGPTVYFTLNNVALRHDIDVLKYLFPVPKEDSKRVMTFANDDDFISFRHHVFVKTPGDVQLAEVGPRFEMKPYEIRQGTIEQTDAEKEWVLAHYSRTAKKRGLLSSADGESKDASTKRQKR
ncbi:brix domain-containing protein [Melanogaster broomeanus]|nr:brix domain-containing protein [Melanogaster broomeanus]